MLHKTLLYKKAACKMLVKLTPNIRSNKEDIENKKLHQNDKVFHFWMCQPL